MKDILPEPRVSMLALKLCGVLLSLRLPLSLYAQVTPDSGAGLADAWRARVSEESEQYINTLRAERLRVKTALVEVQESPGRVWQASPDVVGARDPAPFTSTLNALLRGEAPTLRGGKNTSRDRAAAASVRQLSVWDRFGTARKTSLHKRDFRRI